ncbi:MAG TPA: hypothetical protein VGX49_14530 [Jatrophihabitans sp.]|nr:hypothetical protein [Jatrophihabitans sp.]
MLDTLVSPAQLADFVPLAERAVSIEATSMIRFRAAEQTVAGFVRLPYEVLAGRTLAAEPAGPFDTTVAAADFLRWAEQSGPVPPGKDAHWLSALPPRRGWRRVDVVPDSVIRDLVRSGAALAAGTTSRQSQESLLASVVLTAASGHGSAPEVQVRLGALSALTRMGFLPRDSEVAIDVAPGWVRVAAAYGSTYVSDGNPLGLMSL